MLIKNKYTLEEGIARKELILYASNQERRVTGYDFSELGGRETNRLKELEFGQKGFLMIGRDELRAYSDECGDLGMGESMVFQKGKNQI